jgi:hypothetical protein
LDTDVTGQGFDKGESGCCEYILRLEFQRINVQQTQVDMRLS